MDRLDFAEELPEAERQLLDIILKALPHIAQIVGGDAVVFDKQGIRIEALNTDGTRNAAQIGTFHEMCKRALANMQPSIGPSALAKGAYAIRIPLTHNFGIAFNNRIAMQKQSSLIAQTQRYQTARYNIQDILGDSAVMMKAKEFILNVAKSSSNVLVYGETGTGKELVAHALHNASDRSTKPFVVINCAAVPESLFESMFFGYKEGSYTGAKRGGNVGLIEEADGGTVFLDEISEMPFNLQVKLLRVIQEKKVMRIGENKERSIDVRFIAATNQDLAQLVQQGQFRADLYYRLNVMRLDVPPLKDRKSDIPILTSFFVTKFCIQLKKNVQEIAPCILQAFNNYDWQGNIRELENCIEYMINVFDAHNSILDKDCLPDKLKQFLSDGQRHIGIKASVATEKKNETLNQVLKRNNFNKTLTAKELGISRTTLWRKMKSETP